MTLSLNNLEKSIITLEKSTNIANQIENSSNIDLIETVKSGVIQNFKICYDTSWKTMERFLDENSQNFDYTTKRSLFTEAARYKLIDDVEKWMYFNKARILTTHLYQDDTLNKVFLIAKEFSLYARKLLLQLKE